MILFRLLSICATLVVVSSTSSSKSSLLLPDFLQARAGPTGHSVWVYTGALYDPLNGQKIANVQGLELVRKLAETDGSVSSRAKFQARCGDLEVAQALGLKAAAKSTSATKVSSQQEKKKNKNKQSDVGVGGGDDATMDLSVDYAGTLLSRKLFCYTEPKPAASSGNVGTRLLRSIRLRPGSPERSIPMDQAATVYDSASTFLQKKTYSNNNNDAAKEWIVHTEWPDGRVVWTTTQIVQDHDSTAAAAAAAATARSSNDGFLDDEISADAAAGGHVLEFSAYARPQSRGRSRFPDLTPPPQPVMAASSTKQKKKAGLFGRKKVVEVPPPPVTTTVSPKRSALIQFGNGGSGNSGDPKAASTATPSKFGARETYCYTLPQTDGTAASARASSNSPCTVRYTRYGEGPIWYGPGRLCTLELTGKRITNVNQLPRNLLVSQLAMEKVLGFLTVNSPVPKDDQLAAQAVATFRGKGRAYLQVAPVSVDDERMMLTAASAGTDNKRRRKRSGLVLGHIEPPLWVQGVADSSAGLWNRLRSATSIHIGGRS